MYVATVRRYFSPDDWPPTSRRDGLAATADIVLTLIRASRGLRPNWAGTLHGTYAVACPTTTPCAQNAISPSAIVIGPAARHEGLVLRSSRGSASPGHAYGARPDVTVWRCAQLSRQWVGRPGRPNLEDEAPIAVRPSSDSSGRRPAV